MDFYRLYEVPALPDELPLAPWNILSPLLPHLNLPVCSVFFFARVRAAHLWHKRTHIYEFCIRCNKGHHQGFTASLTPQGSSREIACKIFNQLLRLAWFWFVIQASSVKFALHQEFIATNLQLVNFMTFFYRREINYRLIKHEKASVKPEILMKRVILRIICSPKSRFESRVTTFIGSVDRQCISFTLVCLERRNVNPLRVGRKFKKVCWARGPVGEISKSLPFSVSAKSVPSTHSEWKLSMFLRPFLRESREVLFTSKSDNYLPFSHFCVLKDVGEITVLLITYVSLSGRFSRWIVHDALNFDDDKWMQSSKRLYVRVHWGISDSRPRGCEPRNHPVD